ncbi:HlyD family efflux transporter periplasmic adaptor subunit [Magnetococcus sp. PR-3]|uniref:HlyD family efflux transporter periplasmic adaptor subunit n=1 Tax=Magnetococcus sp. PR-3 TaxID=3120355 RepID=UPI002FCDE7F7
MALISAALRQQLEALYALRACHADVTQFWPDLMRQVGQMIGADCGFLMVQEQDVTWKVLADWQDEARLTPQGLTEEGLQSFALELFEKGMLERPHQIGGQNHALVGVKLVLGEGQPQSLLIFHLSSSMLEASMRPQRAMVLGMAADLPRTYAGNLSQHDQKQAVHSTTQALDMLVLINEDRKFLKAAMTLCNELAARYQCVRVALGWQVGAYIKVQAISHLEQFKGNLEALQRLENAMEEAADQDQEILWPKPAAETAIVRDHERLSRHEGVNYLISLPIRIGGQVVGVVTLERMETGFTLDDAQDLRLLSDVISRRLHDLKRTDRWVGARMVQALRQAASGLLGPEHTLSKLVGMLITASILYLAIAQWTYRVEADFQLQTDNVLFLTAPFDGFLAQSHVQLGHQVQAGDLMANMDVRELHLDESSILADILSHSLAVDKAKALGKLADMRIAQAKRKQSRARLKRLRYMLEHATLRAPMDGVLVEGELGKMLGSPVRKGEVLLKLATTDDLYAEIEVDETEIHEIKPGDVGEIAFRSQPDLSFPIEVEVIHPVAVSRESANRYIVRAKTTVEAANWWRPGMSGVAKIEVGERRLFWILSHRTVNLLRLLFWY